MAEFSPVKDRGRIFLLLEIAYTAGLVYSIGCAYFILDKIDSGNWRLLLLINSLPGLITVPLVLIYALESPRYLLCNQ